MRAEKVILLVREERDQWEGLRSTLGLGVENLWVACCFINTEIKMKPDKEQGFKENLEMLEELEGEVYTNVPVNAERYKMKYLELKDLAKKLSEYDLVVPF
ncbi:MAG: hypothetical protein HQK58_08710 [Deltaproteobacteria bacterium]|nr:hypothetical protein [Deltaproteobacteria bacterium]